MAHRTKPNKRPSKVKKPLTNPCNDALTKYKCYFRNWYQNGTNHCFKTQPTVNGARIAICGMSSELICSAAVFFNERVMEQFRQGRIGQKHMENALTMIRPEMPEQTTAKARPHYRALLLVDYHTHSLQPSLTLHSDPAAAAHEAHQSVTRACHAAGVYEGDAVIATGAAKVDKTAKGRQPSSRGGGLPFSPTANSAGGRKNANGCRKRRNSQRAMAPTELVATSGKGGRKMSTSSSGNSPVVLGGGPSGDSHVLPQIQQSKSEAILRRKAKTTKKRSRSRQLQQKQRSASFPSASSRTSGDSMQQQMLSNSRSEASLLTAVSMMEVTSPDASLADEEEGDLRIERERRLTHPADVVYDSDDDEHDTVMDEFTPTAVTSRNRRRKSRFEPPLSGWLALDDYSDGEYSNDGTSPPPRTTKQRFFFNADSANDSDNSGSAAEVDEEDDLEPGGVCDNFKRARFKSPKRTPKKRFLTPLSTLINGNPSVCAANSSNPLRDSRENPFCSPLILRPPLTLAESSSSAKAVASNEDSNANQLRGSIDSVESVDALGKAASALFTLRADKTPPGQVTSWLETRLPPSSSISSVAMPRTRSSSIPNVLSSPQRSHGESPFRERFGTPSSLGGEAPGSPWRTSLYTGARTPLRAGGGGGAALIPMMQPL